MNLNGKKIAIKNEKRFFLFLTCMGFITLLIFNCILVDTAEDYEKDTLEPVIVGPGDTLWDIVTQHQTTKKDIRKQIYHIKKLNHLETSYIYPGQELLVPKGE